MITSKGNVRFNNLQSDTVKYEIEDEIVDSTTIAVKGMYKIILKQIRSTGGSVVYAFQLFEKRNEAWLHIQEYKNIKDEITRLDPRIEDFNEDGCNDIAITTAYAARGINKIRTLFVFDKNQKQFLRIKNSENYPNLHYNSELHCIDAWLVYGGYSTVFLKLTAADTLKEFARVDTHEGLRTSYELDKSGKMKALKTEKVAGDHSLKDILTTSQ